MRLYYYFFSLDIRLMYVFPKQNKLKNLIVLQYFLLIEIPQAQTYAFVKKKNGIYAYPEGRRLNANLTPFATIVCPENVEKKKRDENDQSDKTYTMIVYSLLIPALFPPLNLQV